MSGAAASSTDWAPWSKFARNNLERFAIARLDFCSKDSGDIGFNCNISFACCAEIVVILILRADLGSWTK